MSEQFAYLRSARRPRPGRPRKAENAGTLPGTSPADASWARSPGCALDLNTTSPLVRLLDLRTAAAYLGVSPWTVRDLEANGTLSRVRIPAKGKNVRKLLFDRQDLDKVIEAWKQAAP